MTTIAGVEISEVTIDGEDVIEITVDGDVVWTAVSTEIEWAQEMDTRYLQDSSGFANHLISGGTSFVQQGYDHGSLTRGLIGYWPLDEGIGTTATDEALGHDGDIEGASWSPDSSVGTYSLEFDGVDDRVNIGTDPVFEPQQLTVTVWVNVTGDNNDSWWAPVCRRTGSAPDGYWIFIDNPNMDVSFSIDWEEEGRVHADFEFPEILSMSEWNHLAMTWNGETFAAYLNGELLDSSTQWAGNTIDHSGPLYIGYDDQNDYPMLGNITDVRIYDRGLSTPEIQSLYKLTEPSVVNPGDTLQ